jgi:hypothetical protein
MSGIIGYGNAPVKITTGFNSSSPKEWTFDDDGTLRLPEGAGVVDSNGIPVISGNTFPPASETQLGGVKIDGITININEEDVISAVQYSLPIATDTLLGGIKVDDVTITINEEGVITATPYVLPTATTSVLGGVKVDGTSITITDGVISSVGGGGGPIVDAGNFTFEDSTIYSTDNNIILSNNFDDSSRVSTQYWYKKISIRSVYGESPYEPVTIAKVVFDTQSNIIVGYMYEDYQNIKYSVIEKYDPTGNVIWKKSFDLETNGEFTNQFKGVEITSLRVDTQDNIIAVTNHYYYHGFKVSKFDKDGNLLWGNLTYFPSLDEDEEARIFDVSIGPGNIIFATGNQYNTIIGFHPNGNSTLFTSKGFVIGTPESYYGTCCAATADLAVLVGDNNGLVHKFDANGNRIWTNRPNSMSQLPVFAITQSATAYYAVIGSANIQGYKICAYNVTTNDPLWSLDMTSNRDLSFGPFGPSPSPLTKMYVQQTNGYIYATGVTRGLNSKRSIFITKINATDGNVIWLRTIDNNNTKAGTGDTKSIRILNNDIVIGVTYNDVTRDYQPDMSYIIKMPIDGSLIGEFGDLRFYDDLATMNINIGIPETNDQTSYTITNSTGPIIRLNSIFSDIDARLVSQIDYLNQGPRAWNFSKTLTFPNGTQQITAYDGYAENTKKIGVLEDFEVSSTFKRVWSYHLIINQGNGRSYASLSSYENYDTWIVDSWRTGSFFFLLGNKSYIPTYEGKDGRIVTIRTLSETEIWLTTNTTGGFEDPENPETFLTPTMNGTYEELKLTSYRLKDNRTYTWIYNEVRDNWFFVGDSIKPGGTISRTLDSNVDVGTPTVVWTAAKISVSSAKLLIQIEANEIGDTTGWHCQSCEAMISSRGSIGNDSTFGIGLPNISVYGITYTSTGLLMTFTIQRNITTNLIEIIGTATGIVDTIANVRITSTEIITRDI